MALLRLHALLKEGAEDRRPHPGPVGLASIVELLDFASLELEARDLAKEPAVEVRRSRVAASGGYASRVHRLEQAEDEVVGALPGQ